MLRLIRHDFKLIESLIEEKSKVLDLGCGDGDLLYYLKLNKKVIPYGVEISEKGIMRCIEKGVSVFQGDIDEGLSDFKSKSFDYVILSQTLQVTKKPYLVLKEMLRVGKKCIVSFPNFGYYRIRFYLLLKGRMPKVKFLPYEWYDTPNIHHLTIKDFYDFCKKNNIKILKRFFSNKIEEKNRLIRLFPNLFAQYGIFLITKDKKVEKGK